MNDRKRSFVAALAAAVAASACAVTVGVDETSAGRGSVSWTQRQAPDGSASLTLKASASAGFAFSGWSVDGAEPAWDVDLRNPSLSGVTVPTNSSVLANFVACEDDMLAFDFADIFAELECGEPFSERLDINSLSYPTLSFKGLPAGLSYDPVAQTVSGTPTSPCENTVAVSGSNGSGYRFTQVFHSTASDVSGGRIVGQDVEVELGAYFSAEFDELFACNEARASATLSGLPPGLTWKESWNLLYGTPTKAGVYVVKAVVRFTDGRLETATMRFAVLARDPADYDVSLDGLDGLSVGDRIESRECEIGSFSDGLGILSVSGLPTGLSVETWTEAGVRFYGVVGRVRKAGLYTVSVLVGVDGEDSTERVVTEFEVAVADTPYRYLKIAIDDSSPDGSGSVSGGGAMSVVSGAAFAAKAAKGFVFAGWFDAGGDIADLGEGRDYRTPSFKYGEDEDFDFTELYGRFAPAAEDGDVLIDGLNGESFAVDAEGTLYERFAVSSASLPVLSAKGLPAGVSIVPAENGEYSLVYDGETASKQLSPGRYSVTVTATNQSKASAAATFVLVVENVRDPRIDVADDYGEFSPGGEIEPIDLSGAVDFAAGETIAVSGLPRGLVWNGSANAKTGAAAHTITGVPTQPGYYTLTFTAKVVASATTNANGKVSVSYEKATATSFLTVLPYPALAIEIDDEASAAGCSVSGGGNYRPGTKVTLKAKAAKGWVFAGWNGLDDVDGLALLNPTLQLVTGEQDLALSPTFVTLAEDSLVVDAPGETQDGFDAVFQAGVDVGETENATLVADLVESVSLPVVKVSGLPTGVKYSASTLALSGKPTKAGVYYVTLAATNAGGYSFTRILRVAVSGADGSLPEEPPAANAADIDFSPLFDLVTGTLYAEGDIVLYAGQSPVSGAAPVKAVVSGVPAGLKALVAETEDGLEVSFVGTPSKVARHGVEIAVTYADRTTLKSKEFVVLEDGGSAYLDVVSADEAMGAVAGSGVYSAGATVKISAKARHGSVFAGWFDDESLRFLFEPMSEADGIDCRTASASFPFRPDDLPGGGAIYAGFVPTGEDDHVEVDLEGGVWEVDPGSESVFGFAVDSLSLPKLSVKNLPKGVSVDLARGLLSYAPTAAVQPGVYAVSMTAQNQSKASATATFEIRVANRETGMISGLDSGIDAYPLSAGVALDPSAIVPVVGDGATLSVKGLPAGLTFKNGVISGVPTKAGDYTVTLTAAETAGKVKTTGVATITLRVAEPPPGLAGTFNGFVYDDASGGEVVGVVTATAAGKISASVKTLSGTERFSCAGWTSLDNHGVATCEMSAKGGSELVLSADSAADWTAWQMSGEYRTADALLRVSAQRNAFDAKTGDDEARAAAARTAGTYSWSGLTASVQKTGVVRFSGKYSGVSISGSSVLFVEEGVIAAKHAYFDKKRGVILIDLTFGDNAEPLTWTVLGL